MAVQPPPPSQAPYPYAAAPPTNTLAIVSLVCGIASWAVLPVVGAIAAVITGHMARAEIRRTGESGSGLALTGLILGYAHLAAAAIVVVIVILIIAGLVAFGAGQHLTTH